MPPKSNNSAAAEFCSDINVAGTAALYERMMRSSMTPFSEHEIDQMKDAGWAVLPSDSADGLVTAKREQDGKTQTMHKLGILVDPIFVVIGEDPSEINASPDITPFVVQDHIAKFIAAVQKENNGWGKLGEAGLMYRGHNIFEIYTNSSLNERIMEMISNCDDLRIKESCDMCMGMQRSEFASKHPNCDVEDLLDAFGECCKKNSIKPADITSQEVYLGYSPVCDCFYSAWDVFGSENAGCVLLSFEVDDSGYVRLNDVEDGSSAKFYSVPEPSPIRMPGGGGRSMYELVSGGRGLSSERSGDLLDIRLD